MRSTARRLSIVTGSVLLAVLALAGPALAAADLGTLHGGRGAISVAPSTPSPSTTEALLGSVAALAVIGLVGYAVLLADRRTTSRLLAAGAPATAARAAAPAPADAAASTASATTASADAACDEVACEFRPRRDESRERKAA